MADPPPEDPSCHLKSDGESPQPLVPEFPESSLPGDATGAPQPAVEPARPPLAELNPNGDSLSSPMAASKTAPLKQPALGVPLRKLMKKKSSTKLHPYHAIPREEILRNDLEKAAVGICEDPHLCNLQPPGLEELNPRAGLAVVVQPLQTIEAENVSLAGEDDDSWSDDEEVFDVEDYYLDDRRRAELKCLMEKYEVYDEEQLRLALRRERRLEKMSQQPAENLLPSSESAPTSPTENQSRFIPPSHVDIQPCNEDPLAKNISYYEGKSISPSPPYATCHISHHLSNPIAHDTPPTISMQPQSIHVTPIDVDEPPTNTNNPMHPRPLPIQPRTPCNLLPMHPRPLPIQPRTPCNLLPPHAFPNPMHPRPTCKLRLPPCIQPNTRTPSPIRTPHPSSTVTRAVNKPNPSSPRLTRALWSSVPTLLPPPMVAPSLALPLLTTPPKGIKLIP